MTIAVGSTLHAMASGRSLGNAFGVGRVGRFIRGCRRNADTPGFRRTRLRRGPLADRRPPNREVILVDSRGLRRFAATPGHATKHPRPRRGRRGNGPDVRCRDDVARERVGPIPRKRLRRCARWSLHPGVSAKRRHPRLSTNTPSAWPTRRPTPPQSRSDSRRQPGVAALRRYPRSRDQAPTTPKGSPWERD